MAKRKPNIVEPKRKIESSPVAQPLVIPHAQGPFFPNISDRHLLWASIIIMALSFFLYYQSLSYGYVLDDLLVINENKYTKKGFDGLWEIFSTESFQGYFGEKKELVQGNRYRPLSIATFAIEYGIMGSENPAVSHFINILLYGITGIMLMMVLAALFRNFKTDNWWWSIPFIAAGFFIAHPIHTEAVANIKGRDEIMSMLFALTSLYGSLKFMDSTLPKWLFFTVFSYFLALLAKENAITFFAVMPVTIYFFSKADGRILRKLMFWMLVTTVMYLLLRFNTAGIPKFGQQVKDLMNNPFLGMKPDEKFGSIMFTLLKYIQLLFWPHPLTHDYYPYAIPKISLFRPIPMVAVVTYLGLIYLAFKGIKKKNPYSYAIWYYLITLTIVSNIVINLGTFMNERFIFMASAGFCIAASYFLIEHLPTLTRFGSKPAMMVAVVAFFGLSAKTFVRVPVWKDALSLNEAAVAISTNSARANSFMATALFEKMKISNDPKEKKELLFRVEKYAQKALNIIPDYLNGNIMMLGVVSENYKLDNNIEKYIKGIRPIILNRPDIAFIKEFSDYLKGRGHDAELFPFYLEVGTTLLGRNDGRRSFALQYLKYAYDLQPGNKQVNLAMAQAYDLSGNTVEAEKYKMAAQNLQ